jgi:DNA-binding MarR family transcriptional regulator
VYEYLHYQVLQNTGFVGRRKKFHEVSKIDVHHLHTTRLVDILKNMKSDSGAFKIIRTNSSGGSPQIDSCLTLCQHPDIMNPQINPDRTRSGEEMTHLMLETFRLHDALLVAGDGLAAEFGLTRARWQVLIAIRDNERTVSGIARAMSLSRQSVQGTTRRLERDGFIELKDNPDHARAKLVFLTETGETALRKLFEKQTIWVADLAKGMEPANIRIGVGMMRGLISRLTETDRD